MKLGAYSAKILVDGNPLDEFQADVTGNHITCWVASEEGKIFKIAIEREVNVWDRDSILRLYLDGASRQAFGRHMDRNTPLTEITGQRVGLSDMLTPFKFERILTAEEIGIDASGAAVGSIDLKVYRGMKSEKRAKRGNGGSRRNEVAFDEETVKKQQVSHVVGFADAVGSTRNPTRFRASDPKKKPSCHFTFKYRSREVLQAMSVFQNPAPLPSSQSAVAGPSTSASRPRKKAKVEK